MSGSRSSKKLRLKDTRLQFETLEDRRVMSATGLVDAASAELQPVVQIPAVQLTPQEWVQSLTYTSFHLIPADQIQYLTLQQVSTIPNAGYFGQWSAASRAALSAPQVQALNVSAVGINLLTTQQIGYLTAPQIQSLPVWEFEYLGPAQVPFLTSTQIGSITEAFFQRWTAAERAALSVAQIRSLNMADVSVTQLTSSQLPYLTAFQIQAVPIYELEYLSPTQIPYATTTQVAGLYTALFSRWTPEARAALSPSQVQAIDVELVSISYLTPTQVSWLTTSQVQLLNLAEFVKLTPSQISLLTPTQISTISSAATFTSWTAEQRAALTINQVRSINTAVVRPTFLNATQMTWLTAAQVRLIANYDFNLLPASHIPFLTNAQIASIPAVGYFAGWTAAARAALTSTQIQAISPAALSLPLLTTAQISVLTKGQIQSVPFWDLSLLRPTQIPLLTPRQIASLTSLSSWSNEARAAIPGPLVQWLKVNTVQLDTLTAEQRKWLTAIQVRSLPFYELQYLRAEQIPYLTTAQIAAINARAVLVSWSPAARAALTMSQVRALDVANAGITLLTPTQVSWLTSAQLQAVANFEWSSLNTWQIPLLSPTLFASLPAASFLHNLPDQSEAALTRAQLVKLPLQVWAEYSLSTTGPSNYHPIAHMPIGSDGLPVMPNTASEMAKFFALAPLEQATHVAVASGDWTNPAIWSNGIVPTAGAKVAISAGATVRFNAYMTTAIDTLRIDGKLEFATNQNTQLKVDTILVTTFGKLHIGTATNPIQSNFTARVLIPDNGPINTIRDPNLMGRGLVSRGEVRMFGADVTSYATFAQQPAAGDTVLRLTAAPTNWRVGDRLVITGTNPVRDDFGAEEVTIQAINGSQVTVTPLIYSHFTPAGYNLSVHVANQRRNIEFVAEDSSVVAERPHIVFFHNPNVVIENIGVYGFGRTDKSVPVTDPVVVNGVLQPGTGANVRARYAIHFHHTGVDPDYAPAVVRGSIVVGSPGWGYVNHSSNVNFEDNVAYGVKGAAFVTEDGNEIGSMVRNLAINSTGTFEGITARRNIHDFGFKGHGFWLQGPGINLVDNISAGSSSGGFSYFTTSAKNLFDAENLNNPAQAGGLDAIPVDMVPLKGFTGNTAYAGRSGLEIWHHMFRTTDGQSYIDDFTSWNNHMDGIEFHYASRMTVRNATLIGNVTAPTGDGIYNNRFTSDMTYENLHAAGFQVAIGAPVRGSTIILGGYFSAVDAIYIEKGHDTRRTIDILGNITFATLSPAQLQGQVQHSVYMSTNVNFADQAVTSFESFFAPDSIYFRPVGSPTYRLYFYNQMQGAIPFNDMAIGSVPSGYINLKNWELQQLYGKVFAGEMVTNYNATEIPRIYGMVRQVG